MRNSRSSMKLGDFLRLRALRVGFENPEALIKSMLARHRLARATTHKLLTFLDDAAACRHSQTKSRELMAVELKFRNWAELVDAWAAGDVKLGLTADQSLATPTQGIHGAMAYLGWDLRQLAARTKMHVTVLVPILNGTAPVTEATRKLITDALAHGMREKITEEFERVGQVIPDAKTA